MVLPAVGAVSFGLSDDGRLGQSDDTAAQDADTPVAERLDVI